MFSLKFVHALVSGNNIQLRIPSDGLDESEDGDDKTASAKSRNRVPLMLFIPTQELVKDTYRLASIARDIGMDLQPNPSLSHVIFSWPSIPIPSSSSSSSSSPWGSWSLPNDSVPLPFPSFATASLSNLRLFAILSKGYFKLAFLKSQSCPIFEDTEPLSNNNLNCTSLSLYSTRTGERIETMDALTRALLGAGWTLFKTHSNAQDSPEMVFYLYRKIDVDRICNKRQLTDGNGGSGECSRVRELRLPPLDFRNPPLRILQYIVLMTDNIFCLL